MAEKMVSEFEGRLIRKITFEKQEKDWKERKKSLRGLWDVRLSSTFNWNLKEVERSVGKVSSNNNGWKFCKFYEKQEPTNSRISVDVKQENTKKTTLKYITVHHLKTENKKTSQ